MLFFETIALKNNCPRNLSYHQARVDDTAQVHGFAPVDLASALQGRRGQKVKVIYGPDGVSDIQTGSYSPKPLQTLRLQTAGFEYGYKYLDRSAIDAARPGSADEILFVKNGLLTDTRIANVAFYDGSAWITPKTPLLPGTARARLLHNKKLTPADITPNDLDHMQQMAVMNAMLGFAPLRRCRIDKGDGCILTL